MLRVPSARIRRKTGIKLNLFPFVDLVLILVFFLLTSSSVYKIYEIGSPLIVSADSIQAQKNESPLTLKAEGNHLTLSRGDASSEIQKFPRSIDGSFNYEEIKTLLGDLKKQHPESNTLVFEPNDDLTYEEIIRVMDAGGMYKRIIFGNLAK